MANLQRLLRQQLILAKFGELALRSTDLDLILTEACRLIGEALGTDLAKVVELQKDGKTLVVRAGVGWRTGVIGVATIVVGENTSEALALKTGEPLISPDSEKEMRFNYPPFLVENGVRAVANVVIIGGEDRPPFGILQVDSREPRQFTDDDTTFLRGYANLIAAAVDRLRALEDLRDREAQLRQAQKLEAVGRLAAGVAHDFNNILQSVSGGLELVLDDMEKSTPAYKFAAVALTSARRGSYLTHHLLSYARKQLLQPVKLDVALLLSEMLQLLTRTLGQHIEIKIKINPELPWIYVDPGQLQMALLNLAINGAQAMPQGGVLTLEGREETTAGKRKVVIGVTDTGVGMTEATQAQVFEPFFSTRGLGGSGLGLSVVQGFAEQSGGAVHLKSAPGKGTSVELWLPPASHLAHVSDVLPAAEPELRGSGRVLLVDDDADVLQTTSASLEHAGFNVVRATSGMEALAILEVDEQLDVLVTDYAMPGMNGFQLIAEVKKLRHELPILIITGFADMGAPGTVSENVKVLRKPFERRRLVATLLDCMRGEFAVPAEAIRYASPVPASIGPLPSRPF